jgi:phosphoheptose isomerase
MDADGDFVIVWQSAGQDGSGDGVYGQRYNAAGVAQGTEFLVNTYTTDGQGFSSVAMDADGDFVVVWTSFDQDVSFDSVYGQRYNAAGVAQGTEFLVNTYTTPETYTIPDQNFSSVAMDADGDFVVVWQSLGQDGSSYGIFGQRYNAAGVAQGAEFRLNTFTTDNQRHPSIAMDADGDFIAAWRSDGQDGSSSGVYARRFTGATDNAGAMVTGVFLGDRPLADGDALGGGITEMTVAFSEKLNTRTILTTSVASANSVLNGKNWTLTKDGKAVFGPLDEIAFSFNRDTNRYEASLHFRARLTAGAYTLTVKSAIKDIAGNSLDGNQNGKIDTTGDDFTFRFNVLDFPKAGTEFKVNAYTTNAQSGSSAAVDRSGNFVIVWQGEGTGDGDGIFAQRYNAQGLALGGAFRVNETTGGVQDQASVAMDADGDFAVVWTSGHDAGTFGIFGQRFDAVGAAQGAEFQLNTYTTSNQSNASVAMDALGNFVVTWSSYGQDGSGDAVVARRFDAAGNGQGDDFVVNTATSGDQLFGSVAIDQNGQFVIAWEGAGEGDTSGIFARRFGASGQPLDATGLRINTFTTNGQSRPVVASDKDGNFVVAWHGAGTGDGDGVFSRKFSSDGVAIDATELRVNTATTGGRSDVSVARGVSGEFVLAWTSGSQDGSSTGVFAQRYGFAPSLTAFGAAVAYREGAVPTILSTGIVFTNPYAADLRGGKVEVSLGGPFEQDDRLSVVHQGNAANQVGVQGNALFFGGKRIGRMTYNVANGRLTIEFTTFDATTAAVQAVLRRIGYSSVSANPLTTPRTASMVAVDRTGKAGLVVQKTVTVQAVNSPPKINVFAGQTAIATTGGFTDLVAAGASIADPDTTNFTGGKLTLQLTNGRTGDTLSFASTGNGPGEIRVDTGLKKLFYEGIEIGSYTGGTGATALVVTLNANANATSATALLRSLQFATTGTTGNRTLTAKLQDLATGGVISPIVSKTIEVL